MSFQKSPKIVFLFFLLSLCSGCFSGFMVFRVEGTAMLPSFENGQRVLIEKNPQRIFRGDVIVFRYPKEPTRLKFKRVIGLPGEEVLIDHGVVLINKMKLDEPYLDQNLNNDKQTFGPKSVKAGSFYVLGDNRDNSSDSRYWGAVEEDLIIGKVKFVY